MPPAGCRRTFGGVAAPGGALGSRRLPCRSAARRRRTFSSRRPCLLSTTAPLIPPSDPHASKADNVRRTFSRDTPRSGPLRPRLNSRSATRRVRADVVPFFGGGRSTPARRALESPMAMACLVERAPCFPSRT